MFSKWAILLTCAVISACDSFNVDSFPKCSANDEQCIKDTVSKILKLTSKSGADEIDVPPLDPLILKNIQVPLKGLFNMTLEDGQLKGIKDCVIDSIHNDLAKGESNLEVTCDLVFTGKFNVAEVGRYLKRFLASNPVTIDGEVKIKLEKVHLKMQFFYDFIKKDDGNVYFQCHLDEFRYEYDIGNAKLSAQKILLGSQDASVLVENIINQNWNFIWYKFGKGIFDVGMPIFYDIFHRFLDFVPAKSYISDDLTPYVKNV